LPLHGQSAKVELPLIELLQKDKEGRQGRTGAGAPGHPHPLAKLPAQKKGGKPSTTSAILFAEESQTWPEITLFA
jgi:hypothetical protein